MAKMGIYSVLGAQAPADLRRDCDLVCLAAEPATDQEIGRTIFNLLTMYEGFDRRSESSKTVVIGTWRNQLKGLPVDILERATAEWLGSERASFTPQPGDVLAIARRIGAFRLAMAEKARKILAELDAA